MLNMPSMPMWNNIWNGWAWQMALWMVSVTIALDHTHCCGGLAHCALGNAGAATGERISAAT